MCAPGVFDLARSSKSTIVEFEGNAVRVAAGGPRPPTCRQGLLGSCVGAYGRLGEDDHHPPATTLENVTARSLARDSAVPECQAMSYQDEALEESALESAAELAERVKEIAEARRDQAETKKALPREIGN
jgi:hypothetical protein